MLNPCNRRACNWNNQVQSKNYGILAHEDSIHVYLSIYVWKYELSFCITGSLNSKIYFFHDPHSE